MSDSSVIDRLTNETVELLQALIRNQCVNDGTPESGNEEVSARLLRDELEGTGVDLQTYEVAPGRTSLIARWPGTDPSAPALCLMGHTDVVPVSADGWTHDPFGGELIDGEVWGRGAVDMLNLTASMTVVFRHLVNGGKRYAGDIVYFAVADEEAGGRLGAGPLVEGEWDALRCDYVLTEFGGIPLNTPKGSSILVTTAEKGIGWRRLTVKGSPGHGSMPYGSDNALVKAAEVVRRLAEYAPAPQLDELWAARVNALGLPDELSRKLLDPGRLDEALAELPKELRANAHSCSHTSFSPNVISGGVKTNVIPDKVVIEVDIRTLPGETREDVNTHMRAALGDLIDTVDVEVLQEDPSTASPIGNPLWDALVASMATPYPAAKVIPSLVTGGTDSRFFRDRGAIAYGAGLLSPSVDASEFFRRFHGHDERIDIDSLRLTVGLWLEVVERLWD
ncbi:MAG: M20/M25/M40 family metallo-hydrolase [Actinomycetia bacterium]|nr:M20/M25/M40 family metallo-hydrolase [Actinomycetes bacterium]MCP5034464.1 M20/M25/M40 family metallo-hydrolase [Actinomycetes bacterium]